MNIQGWFPLVLTGLISLQSKGLSVFSSTTIQKHQFFGDQPSLRSNAHICTWLLENHKFDYTDFCRQSDVCFLIRCLGMAWLFFQGASVFYFHWLQSSSRVILEPKKIKFATLSIYSPSICLEVIGPNAMILVFWMLSFKPAFSLSSRGSLVPLSFLALEWYHLYICGSLCNL